MAYLLFVGWLAPFGLIVGIAAWLRSRSRIDTPWVARWVYELIALGVMATGARVWAYASSFDGGSAPVSAATLAATTVVGMLGVARLVGRTSPPPGVVRWVRIGVAGAILLSIAFVAIAGTGWLGADDSSDAASPLLKASAIGLPALAGSSPWRSDTAAPAAS